MGRGVSTGVHARKSGRSGRGGRRAQCAELLLASVVAVLVLHGSHARPDSDEDDYDPTACELSYPEASCPANMFCFESGRAGGINRFAEVTDEPLAGCGLGGERGSTPPTPLPPAPPRHAPPAPP